MRRRGAGGRWRRKGRRERSLGWERGSRARLIRAGKGHRVREIQRRRTPAFEGRARVLLLLLRLDR